MLTITAYIPLSDTYPSLPNTILTITAYLPLSYSVDHYCISPSLIHIVLAVIDIVLVFMACSSHIFVVFSAYLTNIVLLFTPFQHTLHTVSSWILTRCMSLFYPPPHRCMDIYVKLSKTNRWVDITLLWGGILFQNIWYCIIYVLLKEQNRYDL